MSLFGQTKRGRTPIFTYVLSQILPNVLFIYGVPWVCEHFQPPLLIALSVVSMEVFAPHKMAEMRLSARLQGGPGFENIILYGFTETVMNRVDYDIFMIFMIFFLDMACFRCFSATKIVHHIHSSFIHAGL